LVGAGVVLRRRVLLVLLVAVVACFSVVLLVVFWPRGSDFVAYGFGLPLDGDWVVVQEFGVWSSGWGGFHVAEDVLRDSEVAVYAAGDGVVRFAGLAQLGYGYVVVIEHKLPSGDAVGEFVCTVYGHLREEGLVSLGQVSRGDVVGYLSANPEYNGGFVHLHFGIRKGAFVEEVRDERRGGWYYGGYTTVFGEYNRDDPVHLEILGEWVNPTFDEVNGEGFVEGHS
jgi:murein DD-endopeptidase MepM/ murein hydrolase activator NlpD